MKKYVNWSIFAAVGLLLAVGITIFHFFILPIAIHYQVTKTLALENGTEAWERFIDTPIPIILKLYFFKVDNPEEMLRGGKPRVTEVGPYVYREVWKKHDVRIDESRDSVFYRQGIDFVFDRNLSGGRSDLDNITTANPITHMLAAVIRGLPTIDIIDELLEFGLPDLLGDRYGVTMTVRVRDLLFDGIVVPCNRTDLRYVSRFFCSALMHYQPLENLYADEYGNIVISVLKFKIMGPVFELSRGTSDSVNLGRLVSIDGQTSLNSWWCEEANKVNGFDMAMFAPFVTKDSRIPVYSSDIKTSVGMVFKEEGSYAEIDGYKFGPGSDFLGDVKEDPKARCYCPGPAENMTIPNPCLPGKGVLDLTSAMNLPAFLTFPHFYTASDNWLSQVDGLDPQPEKHESYLLIEPTTGVPLQGFRRVQINMMGEPLSSVRLFNNYARAMIPLFWLEEGTGLGEKEIDMLRNQLLAVLRIVTIVRWCVFSGGLLIFVVGTLMAIWKRTQHLSQQDDSSDEED